MCKRLWVDDIRNPPSDEYDVARTYYEAILLLQENDYDEIYLDHDLGDVDAPGGEKTGYHVVLWLTERKVLNQGHVPHSYFLLTSNPVGRANMTQLIERYLEDNQ